MKVFLFVQWKQWSGSQRHITRIKGSRYTCYMKWPESSRCLRGPLSPNWSTVSLQSLLKSQHIFFRDIDKLILKIYAGAKLGKPKGRHWRTYFPDFSFYKATASKTEACAVPWSRVTEPMKEKWMSTFRLIWHQANSMWKVLLNK